MSKKVDLSKARADLEFTYLESEKSMQALKSLQDTYAEALEQKEKIIENQSQLMLEQNQEIRDLRKKVTELENELDQYGGKN